MQSLHWHSLPKYELLQNFMSMECVENGSMLKPRMFSVILGLGKHAYGNLLKYLLRNSPLQRLEDLARTVTPSSTYLYLTHARRTCLDTVQVQDSV